VDFCNCQTGKANDLVPALGLANLVWKVVIWIVMQQPKNPTLKKPTSRVRSAAGKYAHSGVKTSRSVREPASRPISRFFNTTGPCNPERHYMLPPAERLVRAQLSRYIEMELFWVLHAPRQTGKTTFLMNWMRVLNASEAVIACYASVEICQGMSEVAQAMPPMCEIIRDFAATMLPPEAVPEIPVTDPGSRLQMMLRGWAVKVAPMPLVVLFDEVDTLKDQTMVSFLRQLRSGFADRGVGRFPVSVALVGMRDLRDYLIKSKDGVSVNPGSPFNIKQDSVSLTNFSREDVHRLIGQHDAEKGQPFEPEAIDLKTWGHATGFVEEVGKWLSSFSQRFFPESGLT